MPSIARTRAKSLRHSQTDAERRLWNCLRKRSLGNHKFVRQLPIGPFIADFVCRERLLVIEVDGVTHADAHEVAYDSRRTKFLETQGYAVMRVGNLEVFTNLDGVLNSILLALQERDSQFDLRRGRPLTRRYAPPSP